MNLHEELGRLGADATAGSSERLASVETADALGARVRRGRRLRTAGGVGSVAAVALVAVGVWAVLPGVRSSEPAGVAETVHAGPYLYQAVPGAMALVLEPEVMLRGEDEVVCGDEVTLTRGVVLHDPAADPGVYVHTELTTLGALAEADGAPESLGDVADEQVWGTFAGGDVTSVVLKAMVVEDGTVVAVSGGELRGSGVGGMSVGGAVAIPREGECGVADVAADAPRSDPLDSLLVAQFWGDTGAGESGLLATIVVDPREPSNVDEAPAAQEPESLEEPIAEPSSPEQSRAADDPAYVANLPALGDDGYLSRAFVARGWGDGLECEAILGGITLPDSSRDTLYDVVIPSWLETGRLYGYGDDALVGGYPIPVMPGMSGELARTDPDEARLVLRSGAGDWMFSVAWSERDDLPYDPPALFVALNQIWDCGSSEPIGTGSYAATLIRPGADGLEAVDLTPITVVAGVPSIPELHED